MRTRPSEGRGPGSTPGEGTFPASVVDARRPSKPSDRVRLPGRGLGPPAMAGPSRTGPIGTSSGCDGFARDPAKVEDQVRLPARTFDGKSHASAGHWRAHLAVTQAPSAVAVRLRPDACFPSLGNQPQCAGWRNGRRATLRGSCPEQGVGVRLSPRRLERWKLPRCAGAPPSLIRTVSRLDSGAWDSFSILRHPPSRGPAVRRPAHIRVTVVRFHPGRLGAFLSVRRCYGRHASLVGRWSGFDPRADLLVTRSVLESIATGPLVQWNDAGIASRKPGFDSPAVHSVRLVGREPDTAWPGLGANEDAPRGYEGSNPSPSAFIS
jgi:hypothetical protein